MSHSWSLAPLLCLLPALLFAQTGEAQKSAIPTVTTTTPEKDAENPRALALALDEAIRTAVGRGLGVQIESYNLRMAGESLRGSTGIFDPVAGAAVQQSSDEQPVSSAINATKSELTLANVGVRQLLPTGGSYQLRFNNMRRSSNDRFTFVDPSYGSELGFNFTQPLLRDFGVDVTRRGIHIARNTLGISKEAFRDRVSQSIFDVEQAYLDLIYTRRNLDVRRQSLVLARDQDRITQIRIDVGAAAPLDILEPRVAIAQREEDLITAEALVRTAEDRLRRQMNLPPEEWDRPIIPDEQMASNSAILDSEAAVARAMELRPELRQANLVVANRRIQNRYARNQILPQLDLTIDYGYSGLGPELITDPETGEVIGTRGGYGEALSQVSTLDFPSWSAGLNFGVPIRNVAARAEARRSELDIERTVAEMELLRQDIALEVRQAVRDIETAERQISAARASREAAERNVDAERKRYENGMSTNFDVLRVQQDLSDAKIRELNAVVGHRKAVATYHRAVGDLAEARDIAVEEPASYDVRPSRLEGIGWLNYE